MSEPINDYIQFVEEQIDRFQKNTALVSKDQIFPETLNRALAEYGVTSAALISEYQRAKLDHYQIESEFQDWWDDKVSRAKAEILEDITGKKYPAFKEYELKAKQDNLTAYRDYQDRLVTAERKVSFLQRLLETFKKQDQILVNLSLNMRSELKALSLEDRMNSNPKKRRARKPVSTEVSEEGEDQ